MANCHVTLNIIAVIRHTDQGRTMLGVHSKQARMLYFWLQGLLVIFVISEKRVQSHPKAAQVKEITADASLASTDVASNGSTAIGPGPAPLNPLPSLLDKQ